MSYGYCGPHFGAHFEHGCERFYPAMDIREEDEAYVLEMELPGLAREGIRIDVKGERLTISGEKKLEGSAENLSHREREQGKFRRVLRLKEGIDGEKITSALENGVLTVTLPKSEKGKARRIAVA